MQICMVIPCYNEEKRLNISAFESFLTTEPQITLLFVNDGSRDGTAKLLLDLSTRYTNAKFINLKINSGKAEAIRQGINSALEGYTHLGYWDADLATPLSDINVFAKIFNDRPQIQFVSGIRLTRLGADIRRTFLRHYFGRIFATIVSIMLNVPVYDTQCGAKMFTVKLAKNIFSESFVSPWFFDVELYFRIKKIIPIIPAETPCFEYPLMKWADVGESKLRFKDFLKTPFELFKIYRRYAGH